MRRLLALMALMLTPLVTAQTFTFTAIPDQDETRLRSRFDQVADYLSAELGVEVKYVPVKSYAAAITAFRNNQVQLAWFGGLSGVQARARVPGSQAIAQGYEDQFFKSYFIAHTSTGLTAAERLPETLRGNTFTFGSKGSTSGRLMPEFYLRQAFEQAPSKTFSKVGFSGDHSRTIALVQAGSYQVGAVNYKVWESELAAGHIDTSKVQIIWETPTYPDYHWTIRGDVDATWGDDFTAKVTQALLQMKQPALLNAFPRSHFVPADNDDYQPILDTAKSIGLMD
ncbi:MULTISPECIES: putative selenate ABC transporter substrate-binding protein [Ferrimonas]|uniref:putative selenate ABC transporter substrate-binding protein n=1 Tax=Ferrimonas TaxID=44011 RepID=UPI0004290FFA|nr:MULTISPECIES: putative selenate ABC transporter substrate-binding protein [Ferrimonas]USD36022.1 putative selenate ABC transporter substrate-binding protein [Ferrimonas sp. SCSIO 43195]